MASVEPGSSSNRYSVSGSSTHSLVELSDMLNYQGKALNGVRFVGVAATLKHSLRRFATNLQQLGPRYLI
jgi:hypothetical protein